MNSGCPWVSAPGVPDGIMGGVTSTTRTAWIEPADDATAAHELREAFHRTVGEPAEGVWRAPGSLTLIGEDLADQQGYALPVALPHRTHLALRRRGDGVLRVWTPGEETPSWEGTLPEVDVAEGATSRAVETPAPEPEGPAAAVVAVAEALSRTVVVPGGCGGACACGAGGCGAAAPDDADDADRAPRPVGPVALGADVLIAARVPAAPGLGRQTSLAVAAAVAFREVVAPLRGLTDPELAAVCAQVTGESEAGATVALAARIDHALLVDPRSAAVLPVAWTLPTHELLVALPGHGPEAANGEAPEAPEALEARISERARAAELLEVPTLRALFPDDLDGIDARLGDAGLADRVRHVVTDTHRVLDVIAALLEQDADAVGRLLGESHASAVQDRGEPGSASSVALLEAARSAGAAGARTVGDGSTVVALVGREDGDTVAAAMAEAVDDVTFLRLTPAGPAGRLR